MPETLSPGDIVLVALPANEPRGREQEGTRPAVIVGIPEGQVRFPMLVVAPLTTQKSDWVEANLILYPILTDGMGGLTRDSVVLLDQIRAVDARRMMSYIGSLTPEDYEPILLGIKQIFRI